MLVVALSPARRAAFVPPQCSLSRGNQDVSPVARRGRGALTNASGRHETERRVGEPDGWGEPEIAHVATEVVFERARTIITRNESPDISFDRSINPYRGCEHGCVYCFARPTHANMGLSPGLDFETRLFAKTNAAELLEKELAAPGYEVRTMAMGTNTDPYQPVERTHKITRAVLEVLSRADHPVGIVTKSSLVLRDLDILAPMARKGLVKVALSITTLDPNLARRMEPRACAPTRRLAAIEELARAGVPASVLVAPIIPAINDHELETILTRAAALGAREAGYVMLRLPLELADLFEQWLAEHYPDKLRHVTTLVASMRKGKAYDSTWGERQTGIGPFAWMIGRRFEAALVRNGFARERLKLRTDLFRRPVLAGEQLSLL